MKYVCMYAYEVYECMWMYMKYVRLKKAHLQCALAFSKQGWAALCRSQGSRFKFKQETQL